MSSSPAVTLFVPTWNAGVEFPEILRSMQNQKLDRSFEILVIDSGSTDGTTEFLRREPVRLIEIPNWEFNHGLTRDRGIREARGEIVVLAAQDARPADDQWMQRLIDCFSDPRVAGVYSRQIPRSDANPFVRERMQKWGSTSTVPRVQFVANERDFNALPPMEKFARASFDNVSSSVRRGVALEIPFRERRFGEDIDWAYRALLAGYKIVYQPQSCVIHSHNNSIWYEFKRVYLDHQNLHRLFGVHMAPRARDVARRSVGGALRLLNVVAHDPSLGAGSRLGWYSRAIPYSFTQSLAQYLGARSAARGRGKQFYRWLDRVLSKGV
jgi:rhamnosyltransferase